MSSMFWTRWATCALAVGVVAPLFLSSSPAAAEHVHGGRKSLADCTAFDQADQGEDAVRFTIRNTCTIPVDCQLSWRLVCAPDVKKRRSVHPGAIKATINADGGTAISDASAAVCGDDGWSIDSINWSCQPNKE